MSTVMELNILLILELSTHTKLHLWSIKRPWRMDSPVSSEHQERKKKQDLFLEITVHVLLK